MFQTIIGLECHTQLDTRSKLFCSCANVDVGAPPNSAVCPVCLGHPGTLPVLNDHAVALALIAAYAIGCTVHERSIFARKQYFYPDLPKGYQITQYERPYATGGSLRAQVGATRLQWRVHRIHMEEDAGKSLHESGRSGIDYNRAGTPLIEIVSEADMRSPDEAEAYARMLHRVMVHAGVTQGDLEKGHFRFDANVSLHRPDEPWGNRVEIKNLNSFRFLNKALQYEIGRQTAVLKAGGTVVQETRTYRGGKTVVMRGKEEAADYRYFPEPDLLPLVLTAQEREQAAAAIPSAPLDTHLLDLDEGVIQTFVDAYGLPEEVARVVLSHDEAAAFYEACVAAGGDPAKMANWVRGEILRHLAEGKSLATSKLLPGALVELQQMVDEGVLAFSAAKNALPILWEKGGAAKTVVHEGGLASVSDEGLIRSTVQEAIDANPKQVAKFKKGNKRMIGFFMGQVMRVTRGRADPSLANRIVAEELENAP